MVVIGHKHIHLFSNPVQLWVCPWGHVQHEHCPATELLLVNKVVSVFIPGVTVTFAVLGFCRGKKIFLPGQWEKNGKNRGKNWQNQRHHKTDDSRSLLTSCKLCLILITTLAQTVNVSKYEKKCIKLTFVTSCLHYCGNSYAICKLAHKSTAPHISLDTKQTIIYAGSRCHSAPTLISDLVKVILC